MGGFFEKLNQAISMNNSLVCVDLDPSQAETPACPEILDFNRAVIETTVRSVCAYKFNLAYFEALGIEGWKLLKDTIDCVPKNIPVIADAKCGDIGNTARYYAEAIFDHLGCDALTANPYMGQDSIEPYLAYRGKGVFILCRTSNPGATDFQDLLIETNGVARPLFRTVARKAHDWNTSDNIGLVMGAENPEALRTIRQDYPDMMLLVPVVDARGTNLSTVLACGANNDGAGIIISVGLQVSRASDGSDFARAASEELTQIVNSLNNIRNAWASMHEAD